MAEKKILIPLHLKNSIKILKWKVSEGNAISLGRVILLYNLICDKKCDTKKLKSTQAGTVHRIVAQEGETIHSGEPLFEVIACSHPTVMKDMCAECGADLRKEELTTVASVPMVHSVPELKVSEELAQKLGQADNERLLRDRKLVLLVDLDQTLIHTTNDNIPSNIKDVYHFQLYGHKSPWYHTRFRPGTDQFLSNMSKFFELHICTFGARNYAHMIALFLDPDGKYFSQRILSRDECFDPTSKTANLKALFPCGDNMVCIIDDREDVWQYASNLIHVKPYHFFQHTGDINAPPGLDKHESDNQASGIDLMTAIPSKEEIEINPEEKETKSEENETAVKESTPKEKETVREEKDRTAREEKDRTAREEKDRTAREEKVSTREEKEAAVEAKVTIQEQKNTTGEVRDATQVEITITPDDKDTTQDGKDTQSQEEENTPPEEIDPQPEGLSDKAVDDPKLSETKLLDEIKSTEKAEPKLQNGNVLEKNEIEIKDPDNYLKSLEKILSKIHTAFYEKYDNMKSGNVPDLKSVIPVVRSKVLLNTRLVFSGIVPTHIQLQDSKAYMVAKSLGAEVTQDLQANTTHLVAVRSGTAKVNVARRKQGLFIVTPEWLWTCAESWEKADEKLYPLSNKPSKNRHPPPHCSSPEHVPNFEGKPGLRKRTPSGRFMDTINPLMSFSSDDIADMDREVEDILESDSDDEGEKPTVLEEEPEEENTSDRLLNDLNKASDPDKESSTSDESLSEEQPKGWRPRKRQHSQINENVEIEDESTLDEDPSVKFRRGEELPSDLEIGQDSNSEGSAEAPDEIDDGDWNMMGAALEREFLSNN